MCWANSISSSRYWQGKAGETNFDENMSMNCRGGSDRMHSTKKKKGCFLILLSGLPRACWVCCAQEYNTGNLRKTQIPVHPSLPPRDHNSVGLEWVLWIFLFSKLTGDANSPSPWKLSLTSKALEWVLMKWGETKKKQNKALFPSMPWGDKTAELLVLLLKHRRGNKQFYLAQATYR